MSRAKYFDMSTQFSSELTDKEITYLLNFEYKTSNIYGLPKIHKSALIANEIDLQQSEIAWFGECKLLVVIS